MKFKIFKLFFIFVCCNFCIHSQNDIVLPKKALVTGITGQDGSYLAELLLEQGYEVHGLTRQISNNKIERIAHIQDKLILHEGDLLDYSKIYNLVSEIQPDEVYSLAAQSHVGVSFKMPEYTFKVDGLGVLHLLEAIRSAGLVKKTKFYQASTSELYGKVVEIPQSEKTPFYPRSPYGVAKLFAYWSVVSYREAYGMFACNGILFNHESPRRGKDFVTRKITYTVARINNGENITLKLGNLNAQRDWGHARDYVKGMYSILQHDTPKDYVISTGETHSVREFVEKSFECIGINIKWLGSDINEKGIDSRTGKVLVEVDPQYFRPAEVDVLVGSPKKSKDFLNWTPNITFKNLVKEMVESDIALVSKKNN